MEPQCGMCFLPRRAVEVSKCEIGRAYKVTGTVVEAIAFIVPRKVNFNFIVVHVSLVLTNFLYKAESFPPNIYPLVLASGPSLTRPSSLLARPCH